jgi:hypothetical protein
MRGKERGGQSERGRKRKRFLFFKKRGVIVENSKEN